MTARFALMRAREGLPGFDTTRAFTAADESELLTELQDHTPGRGEVLVPLDAQATTMLLELSLVRPVEEER